MKPEKQYKSDAFASIHETMEGLYSADIINKSTMRDFDKSCLVEISKISGADIKDLRQRENVSQPIFALYLNVSKNLVSDWEREIKKPGGTALRLLSIVKKHGLNALV